MYYLVPFLPIVNHEGKQAAWLLTTIYIVFATYQFLGSEKYIYFFEVYEVTALSELS